MANQYFIPEYENESGFDLTEQEYEALLIDQSIERVNAVLQMLRSEQHEYI